MTPATKRETFRLAAEGLSHRAIARLVDSTHATVAKVLAGPVPLEPVPHDLPAHMARPVAPADDDAPSPDASALSQLRWLMQQALDGVRAASASCDPNLQQRQTRNAGYLGNVLARLEAAEAATSGGFYISPEEIAHTEATIDSRLQALADRGPVTCAGCSRRLSIAWGTGVDPGPVEAGDDV